jgi:hypothetical protein
MSSGNPKSRDNCSIDSRAGSPNQTIGISANIGNFGSAAAGAAGHLLANVDLTTIERIRVKFQKSTGAEQWDVDSWSITAFDPDA